MSAATFDGRLWLPSHYGINGDGLDGTRRITIGPADGDTNEHRRALGVDLAHTANGLTRAERRIFDAIRQHHTETGNPRVSFRDIRDRTGHAANTIAAAADHFEQLGYISRPADAADRRGIELATSWH